MKIIFFASCSKFFDGANNFLPLGDELSMSRNYLLDLLNKNIISNDIYIVVHKDRAFLYENIFNNIIYIHDYDVNSFIDYEKIDFFDGIIWPGYFWDMYHTYQNMLTKELKHHLFKNYQKINYYNYGPDYDVKFTNLVTNIKYIDIPTFQNYKFIVIHHRFKNELNHWDQSESSLINLMIKIKLINVYYKIVIFTHFNFMNSDDNIYITNNLQEYASYIHHENCIALISVWSGGGQFGQYCCNSKVIMYFDPIQCQGENDFIDNKINPIWINSPNAFDFATFTHCQREFYPNYQKMIEDLHNHI